MIPTFWKPMYVINRPIPAGMAFFKHSGIALAMYCLAPVTESSKKITPEMRIMTSPA